MSALKRDPTARTSHASSLLNYEMSAHSAGPQQLEIDRQGAPVTLEKVGDFLEVDLRRVYVWLKAGLKLTIASSLIFAFLAASYGLLATRIIPSVPMS